MSVKQTLSTGLLALTLGWIALGGTAHAERTYTVQKGDSVSLIAQRFALNVDALIAFNGINNPNRLFAGQRLKLPEIAATLPAAAAPAADVPAPAEVAATPSAQPAKSVDEAKALTGRQLLEARTRYMQEQRARRGTTIATAARSYMGTPYRWGGLSSRGLDCSGLVVRAMLAQGKRVPHNAAALYKMGQKVTYKELQPGDLVFFNTMGKGVSHVGIWTGENKFVHASSSRGVVVDKMAGYYSRRLVGAKRI